MGQEELIITLKTYFNALDKIEDPELYGDDSSVFADKIDAEQKLRDLILTERDKEVLSRLTNYRGLSDWYRASELVPLCDTTSAKKKIYEFMIRRHHTEEAVNGMI